jgi:hypothetical protein
MCSYKDLVWIFQIFLPYGEGYLGNIFLKQPELKIQFLPPVFV